MSSSTSKSVMSITNDNSSGIKICRLVVQQCLKASLKFDTEDAPVAIDKGMVVFVCFLQGASIDRISSIVKSVMNAKLCEPSPPTGEKRKSVLDCNHDVLVIPQATLGGKLKGNMTQYHGLVSKDLGAKLFDSFVQSINEYKSTGTWSGNVESGVYGARQILQMETNGPFTHVFEF